MYKYDIIVQVFCKKSSPREKIPDSYRKFGYNIGTRMRRVPHVHLVDLFQNAVVP